MLRFFIPYSFEKKICNAYDECIMSLANKDDWAGLTDGDVLFFQSNFGHMIKEYIDKYPETGMFTCYTNRISNKHQLFSAKSVKIDSIAWHYKVAMDLFKNTPPSTTKINDMISGFLMVIKKQTWLDIRKDVIKKCEGKQLLSVDNIISKAVLAKGLDIRRINNLYMLHYYRMVEGKTQRNIV